MRRRRSEPDAGDERAVLAAEVFEHDLLLAHQEAGVSSRDAVRSETELELRIAAEKVLAHGEPRPAALPGERPGRSGPLRQGRLFTEGVAVTVQRADEA